MKTMAKQGREVLTGIEPVFEGNVGDRLLRFFLQLLGGTIQPTLV
jgi:hypothetical protein